MAENPRTTIARDNDDRDILESNEPPMPSHSGTSGAGPAENIGTRDELKTATGRRPDTDPRARRGQGVDADPDPGRL